MFVIKQNGSGLYFSGMTNGNAVYSEVEDAFLYRRTQACEKEITYYSLEDVSIIFLAD